MVIKIYRFGNRVYYSNSSFKFITWRVYRLIDFIFVKLLAGADIPAECKIGRNIYFGHGAKGVVIHPKTEIGDNCYIGHMVTIGSGSKGNNRAPKIGNNCKIFVGSLVLGEITISAECIIGAQALVMDNMEQGQVAIGQKATIK